MKSFISFISTKGETTRKPDIERRIFWIGLALVLLGSPSVGLWFGLKAGVSFLAGGLLGAANLAWLRQTVSGLLLDDVKRSKYRVLGGYFLRLLLIPLALYAMIRFLFFSAPAAVAGFAIFNCSIFIEGILEAVESTSK